MLAKLPPQLTNGRDADPPHRPAAPLTLLVNRENSAAKPPDRGRLVCRWRAMPGDAGLVCAWEIEVGDDFRQPRHGVRRTTALQPGDGAPAKTAAP